MLLKADRVRQRHQANRGGRVHGNIVPGANANGTVHGTVDDLVLVKLERVCHVERVDTFVGGDALARPKIPDLSGWGETKRARSKEREKERVCVGVKGVW